jgi:hypothetical protein
MNDFELVDRLIKTLREKGERPSGRQADGYSFACGYLSTFLAYRLTPELRKEMVQALEFLNAQP